MSLWRKSVAPRQRCASGYSLLAAWLPSSWSSPLELSPRQTREMLAGHLDLDPARDLDETRVLLDALDIEHALLRHRATQPG